MFDLQNQQCDFHDIYVHNQRVLIKFAAPVTDHQCVNRPDMNMNKAYNVEEVNESWMEVRKSYANTTSNSFVRILITFIFNIYYTFITE